MKIFNKTLSFLFLVLGIFYKAEELPEAPAPPGGGGGGVGPGVPASPIDMYIYLLVLVAIIFMIYFAKKNQKNLA